MLGPELVELAQRVRDVVPELVGLSLGVMERGVTLTLAASHDELVALDAVQYLDGGPSVAAVEDGAARSVTVADLLEEGRWLLFARASASLGIAASLCVPFVDGQHVSGCVTLHASTGAAFEGRHAEVVESVGPGARSAVAGADVSDRAAALATSAPARPREGDDLNVALGLISELQRVNIPIARRRLQRAADRAGADEIEAAGLLRRLRQD